MGASSLYLFVLIKALEKSESGRSWCRALQGWQRVMEVQVQVELLHRSGDFGDGAVEQELSYSQRMKSLAEEGRDGEELHRPW